jgi:hypothetical protein
VEPGIGITVSSMATMRPLFIAFFSRSKLFGSTTRGGATNTRSVSRLGYFRKRDITNMEELELRSGLGFSRSIRVTTTITNTQSTRTERNKEFRTNTSESEMALKGEGNWGAGMETDSFRDVRHYATVEAGVAI